MPGWVTLNTSKMGWKVGHPVDVRNCARREWETKRERENSARCFSGVYSWGRNVAILWLNIQIILLKFDRPNIRDGSDFTNH